MSSGSEDIWRPPAAPAGAADPGGQPSAPAWAGQPFGSPAPVDAGVPAGLAVAAQVLLGVVVLVELLVQLPALLGRRDLARQLVTDPLSLDLRAASRSDSDVQHAALLYSAAFLATGIVFLMWFVRARRNVDAYGDVPQRHSRGWVVGGWFCPVVNLWMPYQVTVDMLRGSQRSTTPDPTGTVSPVPPGSPAGLWSVRAWWAAYLVTTIMSVVSLLFSTDEPDGLLRSTDLELAQLVPDVLAAALAVTVIHRINSAQRRRAATVD